MGENVLLGQVKTFKKGADRSIEQLSAPTLFDRPEVISTTYSAAPLNGCDVAVGDSLDAHPSPDAAAVLLAKGHLPIARVDGEGASSLLTALRDVGSPGVVAMTVTGVSEVSGFISLVVARRNDPNAH